MVESYRESLRLKWADVDEHRMIIYVWGGKGRKDRITLLWRLALDYIRHYLDLYKPKENLFESSVGGMYAVRGVNQFIHKYCQ